MALELRPLGVSCNLACQYCYQNGLREAAPPVPEFDFEAIVRVALERGEPFNFFGGEPLLLPIAEIERLIEFNLSHFGITGSVQTNGVLISDAHIDLFTRYGCPVSISIDGPGELNDARWAGSLDRTRKATEASLDALSKLVAAGNPPAVMVQVGRNNGVGERLERLCGWLAELDAIGIPSARIHVLELDEGSARNAYGLTVAENVFAIRRIVEAGALFSTLRLDVSQDRRELLLMDDEEMVCTYRACDPLVTPAVAGVGPLGKPHKCGLTDKEGVDFLRPEEEGFERYLALYLTPQSDGGCAGCRFFAVCKGQCPGTGAYSDWRNRSESCEVWRQLFTHAEKELLEEGCVPISRHPRRLEVEAALVAAWTQGKNPTLARLRVELGMVLRAQDGPSATI